MLINIRTNCFWPLGPIVLYQSKAKSQLSKSHITIAPSQYQVTKNPANGKKERVFVDLQAVYPTPEVPGTELSFEEIWAANRGLLNQTWDDQLAINLHEKDENSAPARVDINMVVHRDVVALDENGRVPELHRDGRSKKKKVIEVNETQISRLNLGRCGLLTDLAQSKRSWTRRLAAR